MLTVTKRTVFAVIAAALSFAFGAFGATLALPAPYTAPGAVSARANDSGAPIPATLASTTPGNQLLNMAETRAGDWYAYGAAGPSTFDCSGLVYWSAARIGISLPRTTYGMPGSGHLARTWSPQRGDLAFYGSGHVEIVTIWWHTTFGAQRTGTRIGWHTWNSYWQPTAFYRLR